MCALLAAWVLAITLGPWLGSLLTNANKTLVGPSSPAGIVNLQLAFTTERADRHIEGLGVASRVRPARRTSARCRPPCGIARDRAWAWTDG